MLHFLHIFLPFWAIPVQIDEITMAVIHPEKEMLGSREVRHLLSRRKRNGERVPMSHMTLLRWMRRGVLIYETVPGPNCGNSWQAVRHLFPAYQFPILFKRTRQQLAVDVLRLQDVMPAFKAAELARAMAACGIDVRRITAMISEKAETRDNLKAMMNGRHDG